MQPHGRDKPQISKANHFPTLQLESSDSPLDSNDMEPESNGTVNSLVKDTKPKADIGYRGSSPAANTARSNRAVIWRDDR